MEDDNYSLSEIKPDDRARREEIIDTLIELGIVNMNQAQKISNIKVLLIYYNSKTKPCTRAQVFVVSYFFILTCFHLANFFREKNSARCLLMLVQIPSPSADTKFYFECIQIFSYTQIF